MTRELHYSSGLACTGGLIFGVFYQVRDLIEWIQNPSKFDGEKTFSGEIKHFQERLEF